MTLEKYLVFLKRIIKYDVNFLMQLDSARLEQEKDLNSLSILIRFPPSNILSIVVLIYL
jgi:hypothetical protein